MIRSFRDRETKAIFEGGSADPKNAKRARWRLPTQLWKRARAKLDPIDAATDRRKLWTIMSEEAPVGYKREEMKRAPTHPGYVVGMELEELGMTVTEAAKRLGVTRPALSALVNENKSVSPRMALRLGRFFGNGTELG